MRVSYLVFLLATIFLAGTYWYQSTAYVCPVPLHYRIGEIDQSFSLSVEAARQYTKSAEAVWEDEVRRELFVYDETADFTIDFIFDERQATANSEEAKRAVLDEQRAENDRVLAIAKSLQKEHQDLSETYQAEVDAYETRLAAYNREVGKYNDRGGAPPEVFEELETEREALTQVANQLSTRVVELNALIKEINELSERGNQLVTAYNEEVDQYNKQYGFTREFTQGDHQGDKIHIYKFSSDNELITVLAHEFGHALGIGHVDEPTSLMYYLLENTDEPAFLTPDDVAVYREVCGVTESTEQKFRRWVRELLANF